MSKFVPIFAVANRAGQFLAKNPKAGRSQLPCIWTRNRDEAETFDNWSDAAQWGMTLPAASHRSAGVVDQEGNFWSEDHARKAKVFYPAKKKPEPAPKQPVVQAVKDAPAKRMQAAEAPGNLGAALDIAA